MCPADQAVAPDVMACQWDEADCWDSRYPFQPIGLQDVYDIRAIHAHLGYGDIGTTIGYTHVE